MDLSRLRSIKEQQAQDANTQKRHTDLLLDNNKTQEVIVKSFSLLVDYLSKNTTKTEVVNQLREIGTPDVKHVVSAVDSLHSTLKKHENTDLTEITKVMQGVLEEAKKIPKELPKTEKQEVIDYSAQFKALEATVKAVEKAVKDQQIKVEAPVVNVPEAQVNVEAPDLSPIKESVDKSSKEVVKAVKSIPTPEFKTDPIEKLLKKTNKLLEDMPDLMPSGGGGGGRATPYSDSNDVPAFVTLTAGGKVPVTDSDVVTAIQNITIPAAEGGASEDKQVEQIEVLEEIEHAVQAIASARGLASDLRVTLLGGTTAVTGTLTAVTTVTTVTTVGTVTGLTNIGGLPATQIVPATTNTTAVLSNINNVNV